MTTVTCACGRLKQQNKCGMSKTKSQRQRSSSNPLQPLKCDDECARLLRNRNIAEALGVDPTNRPDTDPNDLFYSTQTLDFYSTSGDPRDFETDLMALTVDPNQRVLRTQPAKAPLRALFHSLATDYGFDSESFDPEPHRHVVIYKRGPGNGIPKRTLKEALRHRRVLALQEAQERAKRKAEAEILRKQTETQNGGWAEVVGKKKGASSASGTVAPSAAASGSSTPMTWRPGTGYAVPSTVGRKSGFMVLERATALAAKERKREEEERKRKEREEVVEDWWEEVEGEEAETKQAQNDENDNMVEDDNGGEGSSASAEVEAEIDTASTSIDVPPGITGTITPAAQTQDAEKAHVDNDVTSDVVRAAIEAGISEEEIQALIAVSTTSAPTTTAIEGATGGGAA